jgi:DNA/RNA-binding domain of Phe-tRNA-synthetase-like protein
MITVSPTWRENHPGAAVGLLALDGVANPPLAPALEPAKAALAARLQARFPSREAIKSDPVGQAYAAYYKRFKKTYHVAAQVESVALKGRPWPNRAALVEAVFLAELDNLLLTAVHDLGAARPPLVLGSAAGNERYSLLSGQEQVLAQGDMFMADGQGPICSVIHGPDRRTAVSLATTRVLVVVYGPAGIDPARVEAHLEEVEGNIRLVAPEARREVLEVVRA